MIEWNEWPYLTENQSGNKRRMHADHSQAHTESRAGDQTRSACCPRLNVTGGNHGTKEKEDDDSMTAYL